MASAPRRGTETSKTRFVLLDTTERVMIEDGYAAVTSRRIAKEAGVTPALVHYYFGTLDQLFLAVLRRRSEQQLARHERSLRSDRPLHALWRYSKDPAGTALLMEFMALANHRDSVKAELARYGEKFRAMQLETLAGHFDDIDLGDVPPEAVLVVLAGLSRIIVMERSIGMKTGLRTTESVVQDFLDRLEP